MSLGVAQHAVDEENGPQYKPNNPELTVAGISGQQADAAPRKLRPEPEESARAIGGHRPEPRPRQDRQAEAQENHPGQHPPPGPGRQHACHVPILALLLATLPAFIAAVGTKPFRTRLAALQTFERHTLDVGCPIGYLDQEKTVPLGEHLVVRGEPSEYRGELSARPEVHELPPLSRRTQA